jgi:hypothetical protein
MVESGCRKEEMKSKNGERMQSKHTTSALGIGEQQEMDKSWHKSRSGACAVGRLAEQIVLGRGVTLDLR